MQTKIEWNAQPVQFMYAKIIAQCQETTGQP